VTLKGQTRDPIRLERNISKTTLAMRLQIWYAALYGECQAGAQIIFHESGCGLGHVTPTIFGIRSNMSLLCGSTVGYPSDSLASCQFCYNYMWMIGLVGLINNLGTKYRLPYICNFIGYTYSTLTVLYCSVSAIGLLAIFVFFSRQHRAYSYSIPSSPL